MELGSLETFPLAREGSLFSLIFLHMFILFGDRSTQQLVVPVEIAGGCLATGHPPPSLGFLRGQQNICLLTVSFPPCPSSVHCLGQIGKCPLPAGQAVLAQSIMALVEMSLKKSSGLFVAENGSLERGEGASGCGGTGNNPPPLQNQEEGRGACSPMPEPLAPNQGPYFTSQLGYALPVRPQEVPLSPVFAH